jgi:hypothetical protein
MRFDVKVSKDSRGKWHWSIYGPLPNQASAVGLFEACKGAGFDDEKSASDAGWERVRELEGRTS